MWPRALNRKGTNCFPSQHQCVQRGLLCKKVPFRYSQLAAKELNAPIQGSQPVMRHVTWTMWLGLDGKERECIRDYVWFKHGFAAVSGGKAHSRHIALENKYRKVRSNRNTRIGGCSDEVPKDSFSTTVSLGICGLLLISFQRNGGKCRHTQWQTQSKKVGSPASKNPYVAYRSIVQSLYPIVARFTHNILGISCQRQFVTKCLYYLFAPAGCQKLLVLYFAIVSV